MKHPAFILPVIALCLANTAAAKPFRFTPAERAILDTYTQQSNAVRNRISDVHRQPDTPQRQAELDRLNDEAKAADAPAIPVAWAALKRGYWSPHAPRDPQTDDTIALIVSHSGDLDLQKQTVDRLGPLVKAHLYQADSYTTLFDRVRVKQNLPQRYGTQMHCVDHKYVPDPMEDAAQIEEIRKRLHLIETEAEYLAYYDGMTC